MTATARFIDALEDSLNRWYLMHYGEDRDGELLSAIDINRFNNAVYDYSFFHFCKEDREAIKEAWRIKKTF